MQSLGGLLRLMHVTGHAHRAGAHTPMVLISELNDLQDHGNRSLETTMARAHHGHSDNNFCMVGCWMALWYGATRIAQHPSLHTML